MMHHDIYFHEHPFIGLSLAVSLNALCILANFLNIASLHDIGQMIVFAFQVASSCSVIYVGYLTVRRMKDK